MKYMRIIGVGISVILFGLTTISCVKQNELALMPVSHITESVTVFVSPTASLTPVASRTPTTGPTATNTVTPSSTPTPKPTIEPTEIPVIPVEKAPSLSGLTRLPEPSKGSWTYSFTDTNEPFVQLGVDGSADKISLFLKFATYTQLAIHSDWTPIYQAISAEEVLGLLASLESATRTVYLLPIDPTIQDTTILFSGGGSSSPSDKQPWSIVITSTKPLLVRAPIGGTIMRFAYSGEDGEIAGEEAVIEYEKGIFISIYSTKHSRFTDTYRLIPEMDSLVKPGDPLLWVPPGEDGITEIAITPGYDTYTYNSNTVADKDWMPLMWRVWPFLYPNNLLLSDLGRIVYIPQE